MTSGPPTVTDDDLRRLAESFPEQRGIAPARRNVELFPGYTNPREITRGTYAATPRGTTETVVIRVLPQRHFADPRAQHRNAGNLDRAAHLRVVGVAPVFGRGTATDGRPFVARAHVTGVPIDVFNRGEAFGLAGPPEVPELLKHFAEAVRAVHRAHFAGVLHGGIKPTNILVEAEGATHVLDFGLNLPAVADVTDDVATLGRLLFELLREQPAAPDPTLIEIVARATAADPRQLYATAGAFADDLASYLAGRPLVAPPPSLREALEPWVHRQIDYPKWIPGIGATIGLLIGLYLAVAAFTTLPVALGTPWFVIALLAALGSGALVQHVAGVRTWRGVAFAGLGTGSIAGLFAWAAGAGPAIAVNIQQRASSDTSAAAAGILAPLIPIALGIGWTTLSACAAFFAQGQRRRLPEHVLTYFELSLPMQMGLLLLADHFVAQAANRAALGTWPLTIGVFALAAGVAALVRANVPAFIRAGAYLAGFALLSNFGNSGLPWWSQVFAYLSAAYFGYRYWQSLRPPLFPPLD